MNNDVLRRLRRKGTHFPPYSQTFSVFFILIRPFLSVKRQNDRFYLLFIVVLKRGFLQLPFAHARQDLCRSVRRGVECRG